MDWACTMHEEVRIMYKMLVGEPEGKSPLGKPMQRLKGNIKMDLTEVGWLWTGLIWLTGWGQFWALVNMVANLQVP